MRPNTSIRQPVIANARRQQLSELLRAWRSQPRKRSPRGFACLLTLAFAFDTALLCLAIHLFGFGAAGAPPDERRMYIPYAKQTAVWEPLRHWAIRVDGRPRLFESFCREAVRRVTGAERFEDRDPLAVVVSWMLHDSAWEDYPFLRCDDAEVRAWLSGDEQPRGSSLAPAALRRSKQFRRILRGIAAKGKNDEETHLYPLERRAKELHQRLALFDRVRSGGVDGGDGAEMKTARAALQDAYYSGSEDLFAAAVGDFVRASRRALKGDMDASAARRLAWESRFNECRPIRQALLFSMLAAGLLVVSAMMRGCETAWRRGLLWSGWLACVGCLGWSIVEIGSRAMLRAGVPVGDGAEGMLWSSSVALSLALLLSWRGRDRFIALAGALLAGMGLALANHWPPSFAANWEALPNLQGEDVLLRVQVLTLLSAYAALALAWAVAVGGLARLALAPPSSERLRGLATICIRSIVLAALLLTASAVVDGYRALQTSDDWYSWQAQMMGTLLALPLCFALPIVRRASRIPPWGVLALTALGCAALALAWQVVPCAHFAANASVYAIGLLSCSLTAHAALRYYFGRQRVLAG